MDLEQLRNTWQKARVNSELLETDNRKLAESLAVGRAQTARDKLAGYYRRSFIVALLLPALSPVLVKVLDFPVWIAAVYASFGVVMGILNLCFSNYIKRCDYLAQPIVSALADAVKIARYQRYLRSFGISMGGALIATMFFDAVDHSEFHIIIAFIVGLVLGVIIGIIKFRWMSALTRQMQDELRSLLIDGED